MSVPSKRRGPFPRRTDYGHSYRVQVVALVGALVVALAATYCGIIVAMSGDDELTTVRVYP